MIHGTILGHYTNNEIEIKTFATSYGWETEVRHPDYYRGKPFSAEFYGTDYKGAQERHAYWVSQYKASFQKKSIRISLKTLLLIFVPYIKDYPIIARQDQANKCVKIFEMHQGNNKGHFSYNFATGEVVDCSPLWRNIIDEAQNELLDKINESQGKSDCQQ